MVDSYVVLSSTRKLLSRSILGSSLAGDGLLVRLRSTSIGLLGLVAAVGLGLIAFISQLGWPGVFSQPIPGSRAGSVHDAIALTRPAPAAGISSATQAFSRAAVGRAVHGHGGTPTSSGTPAIGGSRQLAVTGGETTTPASPPAPAPTPVAEPVPQPPAPPAGEATSQPTTTATSSPGPTTASTPKDSSQTSGSIAKSKSAAKTTTKSGEDHGGRPQKAPEPPPAPPKPSTPPAATPPPKDPPEAPEYGGGKDEGGSGKSDWRRH